MGKIIAVTGTTGVGKTTLTRSLAKISNFVPGLENHDDRPFQKLFRDDPGFALSNQIDYLLLRAEQEYRLRNSPVTGLIDGGLDLDFHGFTHLFHYRGLLSDPEFDLCTRFYHFCRTLLPPPDFVVYIYASPAAIRERLASRNRINIARSEDLTLLDEFIKKWLDSLPKDRVYIVDVSNVSDSYNEIAPFLKNLINSRLQLDAGSYETGYIP